MRVVSESDEFRIFAQKMDAICPSHVKNSLPICEVTPGLYEEAKRQLQDGGSASKKARMCGNCRCPYGVLGKNELASCAALAAHVPPPQSITVQHHEKSRSGSVCPFGRLVNAKAHGHTGRKGLADRLSKRKSESE